MTSTERRTELGLIALVALITGGAYALASLGRTASLPANLGPFLVMVVGLLVLAHVAVRAFAPRADPTLLPLVGLLNGLGYVMIVRLDRHAAALQATWTAFGVVGFVVTLGLVRRVRELDRYRYLFGLGGVALLLAPLTPRLGQTIGDSRVWVRIGPLTIQPSEFAKLALLVFCAGYLAEKADLLTAGDRRLGRVPLPQLRTLGPLALAWVLSFLVMVAERELGMATLYFFLFVALLYVATARQRYVGVGAALFAIACLYAYQSFAHVRTRFHIWLNPWPVAASAGYQVVQAAFAFGAGGVAGTGLALGSPARIPAVQTDFIFAAIGEELGLAGTVMVLAAFLLIVGAGLRIATAARHPMDKLVAVGAAATIGFQTFIIVAGVIRLMPLTGLTLPFVSYGGSSLVANYVLLALLLRISDETASASPAATSPAETRSG